jgi:hypothetical protein
VAHDVFDVWHVVSSEKSSLCRVSAYFMQKAQKSHVSLSAASFTIFVMFGIVNVLFSLPLHVLLQAIQV